MKKYGELIRASNKEIKQVYYGEPIRIPKSSLPALIVAKVDTTVVHQNNVEDLHHIRLAITIVTDIRDTISEDKTMVAGVNALYNLMEGRNESDYTLKADSVLYILRHNVEVDSARNLRTDLDSMTRVEYGMTMGKRAENEWSIEGMLEITSHFIQLR